MQHRNHKCLFGTPRTRTQQPVQWGELKSAGAVATLHSWDAWLMPPPPPACCRLLQRRAGYEIPRNDDLFKNLAAWSCRMLLLVGFYKDLCSQWREPFTKFRWQLYCRSSIMFQGCCSFSVRAACCNWLQCLQWCCLDLDGFHFTFKAGDKTQAHSQFIFVHCTRRHSEIFCWWFFVNWDCTTGTFVPALYFVSHLSSGTYIYTDWK